MFAGTWFNQDWQVPEDRRPAGLISSLYVFALTLWRRRTGPGWGAVACFAAAALCRETMLLAPAALAMAEQLSGRGGRWWAWKPAAWRMAAAAVPLAVWTVVLRLRIGAFPQPNNETLLASVPLSGLMAARGNWTAPTWLRPCSCLIPLMVMSVAGRKTSLAPLIYAYGLLALYPMRLCRVAGRRSVAARSAFTRHRR